MREVTAENSKISPTYINKQVVGPSLYRALQEAAKAKRIHGNGMLLLLYIFECETHDELTSTSTSKELFLSEILPSFCSTLALNTSYYCCGGCECSIVMHCNGEELGYLNLVFLKSYNVWLILIPGYWNYYFLGRSRTYISPVGTFMYLNLNLSSYLCCTQTNSNRRFIYFFCHENTIWNFIIIFCDLTMDVKLNMRCMLKKGLLVLKKLYSLNFV